MIHKVAIVGAGIIGMTNAIVILENNKNRQDKFEVTVFSKEEPLATNSDAAVATWFAPNDDNPLLQQCCLESLPKFAELIKNQTPGVNIILEVLYFTSETDFKNSVWAKESVRKAVELHENTDAELKVDGFPFSVLIKIPLINPNFYRPYMLEKFKELGGKLEVKKIDALSVLTETYAIVVNSSGWEAKYLTDDNLVYPIRGQTETFALTPDLKNDRTSMNVEGLTAYVVFRPIHKEDGDCVIGTTFQVGDSDREIRPSDTQSIINNVATFFPAVKNVTTTPKVGIRCGRPEVRIESERHDQSMILHCYGHGGSGYSASWGSANEVLKHCNNFVSEPKAIPKPRI
ncbi:FAD-dependent oxidoreductase [Rickettsiella endosymbiont of Rhagonycha lignosa]|uniref:FAD-dependent oxidoreductase n=1 Tax=Rickettsiella endosymbiont of Rhagonycha lignosa TaxID=3077937 RepID=UPI00313CDCFB